MHIQHFEPWPLTLLTPFADEATGGRGGKGWRYGNHFLAEPKVKLISVDRPSPVSGAKTFKCITHSKHAAFWGGAFGRRGALRGKYLLSTFVVVVGRHNCICFGPPLSCYLRRTPGCPFLRFEFIYIHAVCLPGAKVYFRLFLYFFSSFGLFFNC